MSTRTGIVMVILVLVLQTVTKRFLLKRKTLVCISNASFCHVKSRVDIENHVARITRPTIQHKKGIKLKHRDQ